ncbi:MAG: hypothetical protein EA409_12930 [Saprospirales bacterium]|nr:MAG: hypothetical protein EA409_12930 [Saprospirales bacterium]
MSVFIRASIQKKTGNWFLKKRSIFLLSSIFLFTGIQLGFSQDLENLKEAKPMAFSGNIGTQFTTYSINGINRRMNPTHYGFYANFNLSFYETFDLPIRISYNQFGLDLDKPHFQLGISPKYKWIQVHLGHRNMYFNPYTLAGHTFWGIGCDLTPGNWRFSTMSGQLRDRVLVDARSGNEFIIPQFKRTARGARIGYGVGKNSIDLMVLHAEDDPNSLPGWQDSIFQNSLPGKTGRLAPEENLVMGLSAKLTFFNRILWKLDAGGSLFTRDQTSEVVEDNSVYDIKTSTTFKWAGKTSLGFPIGKLYFNGSWERIMPDYFSMGIYNFVNDMENFTGTLSGSVFKNKLIFSAMLGNQRNNLTGNRSETTSSLISSLNATIMPEYHYGINLSYSNFNFSQKPEAILLDDEVLIKQINRSYTAVPFYSIIVDTSLSHQINAVFMFQEVDDLNPVTREFGNMNTRVVTLGYSMNRSAGWSINAGLNHTVLNSAFIENIQMGATLGAGRNIFSENLNFTANAQFNLSAVDGNSDGSLINGNLGLNYRFKERHSLRLNTNILVSNSKAFESYTEIMGQLGYSYSIR